MFKVLELIYNENPLVFKPVAMFLVRATVAKHKQEFITSKPKAPKFSKGTQQIINETDKDYLDSLKVWEENLKYFENELFIDTFILLGIKYETPSKENWLDDLLKDLSYVGLPNPFEDVIIKLPEQSLLDLIYRKYIMFSDTELLAKFMNFYKLSENDNSEVKDSVEESTEIF